MKQWFLLLIPILLLAEIDEYKSDVYFANGIDTDEKTARYTPVNEYPLYGGIPQVFYHKIINLSSGLS